MSGIAVGFLGGLLWMLGWSAGRAGVIEEMYHDLVELLTMEVDHAQAYDEITGSSEPDAYRLSYPDLENSEEYAGVLDIEEGDR